MSTLTTFTIFKKLPVEIQMRIYKEAITEEHSVKVVPVLNSTKRVVLTQDHLMRASSKFFGLCPIADDVASSIYDCPVLIADQDPNHRTVPFSTKLDIFLVSPWQYTLGLNINSGLFQQSIDAIRPTALSKIKQVMEHQLDLGDLVYSPVPNFDRVAYPSVRFIYIRVDHERPTPQRLATRIGGGPYTQADLLGYYTNPSIYEEVTNAEASAQDEIEDGSERGSQGGTRQRYWDGTGPSGRIQG